MFYFHDYGAKYVDETDGFRVKMKGELWNTFGDAIGKLTCNSDRCGNEAQRKTYTNNP